MMEMLVKMKIALPDVIPVLGEAVKLPLCCFAMHVYGHTIFKGSSRAEEDGLFNRAMLKGTDCNFIKL